MANHDLTPIQTMLGCKICFIDNRSFDRLKKEFSKEFLKYRWEYGFGYIDGFSVDLGDEDVLHFSILVDGDYHRLDDIEILYLS
jgi:hypothetical protein